MKQYLLDGFEPQNVLRHFEDICSIPHGSGHEAALRSHIAALADRYGLAHREIGGGNLLVRVPASPGCEEAAPFLIQGHMDMVLAKEPRVELDLEHEPIRLVLEGGVLRADGTTLGADNAVGLCHMMAMMEPSAPRHPELELLFTTEEEVGLVGIRKADLSVIRSRRMLNMDCGDPDVLVIGAAGGSKYDLTASFPLAETDDPGLCVEIAGLRGGHSGIEAGKRASSVELAGRLLSALCDEAPICLGAMETPAATNGFPRWQKLFLSVPEACLDGVRRALDRIIADFHRELDEREPEFRVTVTDQTVARAASAEDTRTLADFLLLMPFGVSQRSPDHPAWVLCSALLANASFDGGVFHGHFSIRANREPYRQAVVARLEALCRMTGFRAALKDRPSPPWPEKDASPLRELCQALSREVLGQEMAIQVENGSVEVGVITLAIPDMDAVGFAPKSRGAHTTSEHLYLDTMPTFWTLFTALLDRLCDLP